MSRPRLYSAPTARNLSVSIFARVPPSLHIPLSRFSDVDLQALIGSVRPGSIYLRLGVSGSTLHRTSNSLILQSPVGDLLIGQIQAECMMSFLSFFSFFSFLITVCQFTYSTNQIDLLCIHTVCKPPTYTIQQWVLANHQSRICVSPFYHTLTDLYIGRGDWWRARKVREWSPDWSGRCY